MNLKPLGIILLFFPLAALAKDIQPGTDTYLRELGYTDEQLSTDVNTEDREPFLFAEGSIYVADPMGDVLTRTGTVSSVQAPWGDVTSADLTHDESAETWTLVVTVADELPDNPSEQVNLLLYVDADGNTENNEQDGVRGSMDTEFSLKHNLERGWYTDVRWYNPEADFWAVDRTTASAFEVEGNRLALRIPDAELPINTTPRWRVAVAIGEGSATQVDVAPTVGFPPPLGESYPVNDFNPFPARPMAPKRDLPGWILATTSVAVVGLILIWKQRTRAQKKA